LRRGSAGHANIAGSVRAKRRRSAPSRWSRVCKTWARAGLWPAEEGAVTLPSDSFRTEHAELKSHLFYLETVVASLEAASREERRRATTDMVRFLRSQLAEHAAWEENVLYPLIDRQAGYGEPFTATMRHEHEIIERWTHELVDEISCSPINVGRFVRKAQKLLGLLLAHFECEEEVLLPVLDRNMTPEQFESEVTAHA
jgi:hemerythrin-like domain-containing protein